ncbi:MAG: alpha/beta fold hydrolase [Lachnospiraceae bacterium]|nr:alpha/beta fold hydrolase [Lachnospiraceae bacterium]
MGEIKREEFWYDSRDEVTKIHAVRWLPECSRPTAIVQLVHGMTEHVLRYTEVAEFLASQGILVVANDHLGHGQSRREDMPFGYFCKRDPATVAVRDVHRLKKLTQERYPGVPYIILGHSMGSFILRDYLSRYGTGIDGAVIVATGHQSPVTAAFAYWFVRIQALFLGQTHVGKLVDHMAFGQYNKRCEPRRTDADWLNSQPEEADLFCADPLCGNTFTLNGFMTLFTLVRRACGKDALKKVPKDLPVLFLAGKEDPVGDYGTGVEKAYRSFTESGMTDVTCRLYDGARHEILREAQKQEVFSDILAFVHRVVEKEKA